MNSRKGHGLKGGVGLTLLCSGPFVDFELV